MIKIREANCQDSEIVSNKINKLLAELSGKSILIDEYPMNISYEVLNESSNYRVLLAFDESMKSVGLISVSESIAIYTGGRFGIIHEFYVEPECRSANIGGQLIESVKSIAIVSKWKRIEVGAPNPEMWTRTIDFYKRMGFEEIGPRMKLEM